jgi:PAS domain S-box-containing protein
MDTGSPKDKPHTKPFPNTPDQNETTGQLLSTEVHQMNKQTKTNAELIEEISSLKQRIQELEQAEAERKRTEEALRDSESKYRFLAESAADVVFTLDINLVTTYVSPSIERMLGYTPEERIAQKVDQQLTLNSQKLAFEALVAELDQEKEKGADPDRSQTLELEYYHKDGSIKHLVTYIRGIRDSEGNLTGFYGSNHDITERKQAEEELRESEERYRTILESIEDGYFEVDLAGNFTFFNPSLCRILGYPREEMPGMNNRVFMDAENAKKVFRAFNEVYVTGIPRRGFEWETIRKDGARTYIEVSVSLIARPGEKPTGFRGIARDVTERKQTEEKLQRTLESLRKAFGATIQVMVSAVETRDPYTAGHQTRSADLARAIAMEMGLPQEKIDGIRMAGSIHDIGKLSIPAEILSKPTKLSEIEFRLIKEHSQRGYEILKDVESPWPLAQIVYQHHERMDGSGYPRNLKGDEIIMEARILAVSDVVESMASHRPYRAGLGLNVALEEIEKNRGTLYDEAVVDACLRLFREKEYRFAER